MTTIAYSHKDRQIAIDGRTSSGGTINTEYAKKWFQDGGDWWFLCGAVCDREKFIKYMNAVEPERPKYDIECSGFLVRNGKVYHCCIEVDSGAPCISEINYSDAMGSGEPYAIAAMDHGKSAKEAVEYAATRNSGTGPNVAVFFVDEGRLMAWA